MTQILRAYPQTARSALNSLLKSENPEVKVRAKEILTLNRKRVPLTLTELGQDPIAALKICPPYERPTRILNLAAEPDGFRKACHFVNGWCLKSDLPDISVYLSTENLLKYLREHPEQNKWFLTFDWPTITRALWVAVIARNHRFRDHRYLAHLVSPEPLKVLRYYQSFGFKTDRFKNSRASQSFIRACLKSKDAAEAIELLNQLPVFARNPGSLPQIQVWIEKNWNLRPVRSSGGNDQHLQYLRKLSDLKTPDPTAEERPEEFPLFEHHLRTGRLDLLKPDQLPDNETGRTLQTIVQKFLLSPLSKPDLATLLNLDDYEKLALPEALIILGAYPEAGEAISRRKHPEKGLEFLEEVGMRQQAIKLGHQILTKNPDQLLIRVRAILSSLHIKEKQYTLSKRNLDPLFHAEKIPYNERVSAVVAIKNNWGFDQALTFFHGIENNSPKAASTLASAFFPEINSEVVGALQKAIDDANPELSDLEISHKLSKVLQDGLKGEDSFTDRSKTLLGELEVCPTTIENTVREQILQRGNLERFDKRLWESQHPWQAARSFLFGKRDKTDLQATFDMMLACLPLNYDIAGQYYNTLTQPTESDLEFAMTVGLHPAAHSVAITNLPYDLALTSAQLSGVMAPWRRARHYEAAQVCMVAGDFSNASKYLETFLMSALFERNHRTKNYRSFLEVLDQYYLCRMNLALTTAESDFWRNRLINSTIIPFN